MQRHGKPYHLPCTAAGVMKLLEAWDVQLRGKNAVVMNGPFLPSQSSSSIGAPIYGYVHF